ncbi:MAG: hypothetical protein K2G67_06415 [Muribaculaceae bacterium]|nr:hypothetical protein [Muribaculaceae bacterium]
MKTGFLFAVASMAITPFLFASNPILPDGFMQVGDAIINTAPGSMTLVTEIAPDGTTSSHMVTMPESEQQKEARAKFLEGQTTFPLTVTSHPSAHGGGYEYPSSVYVMKPYDFYLLTEDQAVSVFDVPAGVYNIQVLYNDPYHSMVVFPNVEVSGPTEIDSNIDMADKTVSLKIYMPDGELMTLPVDGQPEIPYNTPKLVCHQSVLVGGCCQWTHSITASIGGDETYKSFTLKSNFGEGSEAYWLALTYHNDFGNVGVSRTIDGADVTQSMIVANNVDDYYKVEVPCVHTPVYDDKGLNNPIKYINFGIYRPDNNVRSALGLSEVTPGDLYICSPLNDLDKLHTFTIVGDVDIWQQYGPKYGVNSPSLSHPDGNLYFYCTQEDSGYNKNMEPGYGKAPVNPYFSFPYNKDYVMGSTSAAAVTIAKPAGSAENPFYNYTVDSYYGNFGDRRAADVAIFEESGSLNGEPYDPKQYRNLFAWLSTLAADGHQPGQIDITFTDYNIRVDEIDGINVCKISYNEANDDVIPPTVQRVMLKDADGNPSIKFDKAADAILTVAGGDFTPVVTNVDMGNYNSDFTVYDYSPATLKAEYAPFGTDDFEEIPMAEDVDKYVIAYGSYWEGSLENAVTRTSPNKWYDLRITLTDEAGNTQVQTISPAFMISEVNPGAVRNLSQSGTSLRAIDGSIVASDGSEVKVYSISGIEMTNANLPAGTYIAVSGALRSKLIIK